MRFQKGKDEIAYAAVVAQDIFKHSLWVYVTQKVRIAVAAVLFWATGNKKGAENM